MEVTRDKKIAWKFHDWKHFGNNMPNSLVVDGKAAEALLRRIRNEAGI